MKKALLVVFAVLVCIVGGGAYVGYRTVEHMIATGCVDCVQQNDGGPMIRGSGNITTETRPVGTFAAIDVAIPGNVVIERTGSDSVSVSGDDNLLPLYTSEVKDGTLYLSLAKGKSFQGKMPVFRVTVADLRDVRVAGSGDVDASKLDGETLSVSVSGSSDVRLAGRADTLALSVAGSGSVNAAALQAKTAKVVVSGSGAATVDATDALDVRISGSGDVRYLGAPAITSNITGSGSLKHQQS
jgi:hypothetical protein